MGEGPTEVRKKHESLRADSMFPEPLKARRKTCASAANRIQGHRLAGMVGFDSVDLGVEIQNVHQTRLLARQDGADFRLE